MSTLCQTRTSAGLFDHVAGEREELAAIAPEAVMAGGDRYLRVNYQRLGLRMETWDEWLASH
jgi:hypothetical protein